MKGNIKSNGMFVSVTFILDFFYQMLLREGGQQKHSDIKWQWVHMKAFWVTLTVSFLARELNTYSILQTATYRVSYLEFSHKFSEQNQEVLEKLRSDWYS